MSMTDSFLFGVGTENPVTTQRELQALPLTNFLGGINLSRADSALFDNESGDMCNVDALESGGFCRRPPVRLHTREDLQAPICNIVQWQDEDGQPVLYIVLEDGTVWMTPGGAPANAIPVEQPFTVAPGDCESIEIGFNQYFFGTNQDAVCVEGGPPTQGGTSTVLPWQTIDGVWAFSNECDGELIALGCDEDGNPDFDDEQDFVFGFPRAECMAMHSDFAWAANVLDPVTGERHCNRVYRSFPVTGAASTGQVWGSQDYIDIDPGDGDCITNIISCGANLYVFKNNSVYAITGTNEATGSEVASVKLCGDAGTPSCKTATCCGCILYFWDSRRGLYRITEGGAVEHIFGKLEPLIRKGCIQPNCEPAIGCCNGRIFVSVPERPITPEDEEQVAAAPECANTTTYVLTPETETWVKYTYGLDCYLSWCPRAERPRCLAVSSRDGFYSVVEIERPGYELLLDVFSEQGGTQQIEAYWRSKWFTGTNPFVKKQWCPPWMLVESTRTNVDIEVTYLQDWCIDESIGGGTVPFFENLAEDFEPEDGALLEQITPDAEPTPICPPNVVVATLRARSATQRKSVAVGLQ